MAKSYRTAPESVRAKKKFACLTEKEAFPRIVERNPAPGDYHPLEKKYLVEVVRQIPYQYIEGLKRIELLPRTGSEIGQPWGEYTPHSMNFRYFGTTCEGYIVRRRPNQKYIY